MKVIRLNTETNEQKVVDYPRLDLAPIVGLQSKYKFYAILEQSKPEYDPDRSRLIDSIELTENAYVDDNNVKHSHILIANKVYTVEDYPSIVIVSKLNDAVGSHIEGHFPVWKQIKYLNKKDKLKEKSNKSYDETSELAYYESLFAWVDECRNMRDAKEDEFLNKATFPDLYNWPEIPIKPERL